MASSSDFMNILRLDQSSSSFGGNTLTIMITKDYTNITDFAFRSFLHHFSKRAPKTPILMINLINRWSDYSSSAAKCGYNLIRSENGGSIEVLDLMETYLKLSNTDEDFSFSKYIREAVTSFISKYSTSQDHIEPVLEEPIIIMIDDISALLSIGCTSSEIYHLISFVNGSLRCSSGKSIRSQFIIQTMKSNYDDNQKNRETSFSDLNYVIANLENISDITIHLKSLDTGHSTQVDGTVRIMDNRLSRDLEHSVLGSSAMQQGIKTENLFPKSNYGTIGVEKNFFYKVGDRGVRLTAGALVF